MRSFNTHSPSSALLISTAVLTAALAFGISAAMAASPPAHRPATVARTSHPRTAARIAVRRPQFTQPAGLELGQFMQTLFGGPLPVPYAQTVRNAKNVPQKEEEGTYDSSWEVPSYDSPAPVDNSAIEAAAAQAAADSVALSQTLQAAEEQNDEAQAAFTQDMLDADQAEINANN